MKRASLTRLALAASLLSGAFAATVARAAANDATPPTRLFAAAAFTKAQKNSSIPTDAGTFVRGDDGEWHSFGPKIQQVSSATVAPTDSSLIFLACGNGVMRSRDGGATWRQVTGWEISDVIVVAVDPTDADRVYAASAWGIWRSTDGGESWVASRDGMDRNDMFTRTFIVDPRKPSRLLAGTAGGLYQSTNYGESWKRIEAVPAVNILRLRHGVADPAVWLLGTEGEGVWLSTDDGESWQTTAPGLATANVYGVAVDPSNSDHLAAGGWQTGVHLSTDRGATWHVADQGLPSRNLLAFAFDPAHGGRLWASTFEEGTVFSDDGGKTWQDGGLYGALVNDLGFLPLPVSP